MTRSVEAAYRRLAGILPALAFALITLLPGAANPAAGLVRAEASTAGLTTACPAWEAFKTRYIDAHGRVIDTANGGISHSEGQGYALILAAEHGDAGTFARVYGWTRRHLMLRPDGLLVWKWSPNAESRYPDTNSASDGDLLVAHGLLLAGKRFNTPRYLEAGERLAAAVRKHLIREVGPHTVLLPGPEGFSRSDGGYLVNLSYWVFPTLELLAAHTGEPAWSRLADSGRALIRSARFGGWDLPPDWLLLSAAGQASLPDPDVFAPIFGYNAMRVPLYLAWAATPADPDVLDRFRRFWAAQRTADGLPLVWDLVADVPRDRGRNPGVRAIHDLIAADAAVPDVKAATPPAEGTHYYDAVLALLACLAAKGDSPCLCAA